MSVLVGKQAPDFTAHAVLGNGEIVGSFNFSEATSGKYAVLFFYPLDFTFVCPSELIAFDHRLEEFKKRGVEVIDARITHLAYAPEIAQAMLRRQQAVAVIAAKERIVEGAMGMVEMALNRLSEQRVVELDEERKAAMVSNLLVVLCSDNDTQPVINTGTLYT